MYKNEISAVALNSIGDHCSLAVGFESGCIELLREQFDDRSLLRGHKDSVLSLGLSGQV